MPNVAVFDLTFNPSTSSLVAATHGRGMFRLQLDVALTLAVVPAARTDSAVVGDVDLRLDSAAVVLSGADAGMTGWMATHGAGTWLTVSTSGGTSSGSVRWVRDPTGLAPGWYVDTITVSVPGAAGSPGLVFDSLVVWPALELPTARIGAAISGGGSVLDSAAFQVRGVGNTTATWTATHGGSPWLTLVAATGTGSGMLRWQLNPADLTPGAYADSILLSTSRGDSAWMDVSLVASAPDVSAGCAVQHLLGTACLDDAQSRFLDLVGNRDGTYNLGDLLAHLARSGAGTGMGGRP
jgi:hypothetical protein